MQDKKNYVKQIGAYAAMLFISLVLYGALTVMYAGYLAFGTIFMIVIQPLILFMLFLYVEEMVGKKKMKKYFSAKSFYFLTIIIPIVISILFIIISKFIVKSGTVTSFAVLYFINCGTLAVFAGIKKLLGFIIKKVKKIE